jgi:osmotically-inducible protein OsmY
MNRDDYIYGSRGQGGPFRNFSEREEQWQGGGPAYGGYEYGSRGFQGAYGQGSYGQGERGYGQGGYGQGYQSGQQWSPGQPGFQGFQGGGYGQGGFGQGFQGGYGQSIHGSQGREFGAGRESWQNREFGRGFEGQGYGDTYTGQQGIQQRGHFFGRGPKDYKRSDERIRDDVNEELTVHPDIDAFDIEVRVEGGEVTLTGIVEDRRAKRLAEDVAERSLGVTDVHNQLRVRQGLGQKISNLISGESSHEERAQKNLERETGESRSRSGRSTA